MTKKILLTLLLLLLPLQSFAEVFEAEPLEEDTETFDHPRFIQEAVEVNPKLFVSKKSPTYKFIKFKIRYKFLGEDYGFEDLVKPVQASFFCKFGEKLDNNGHPISAYEYNTSISWDSQPPLQNGQIITKEVIVPLPKKHINLLKNNNHCQTYPDSVYNSALESDLPAIQSMAEEIRELSAPYDYWLKQVENKLKLTPRFEQNAALNPKETQTSIPTSPIGTQSETPKYEFAKCLTEKGIKLYGAKWCPYCNKQKEAFGDAFKYINYIECYPDGGSFGSPQAQICTDKNITAFPTWELAGGKQMMGFTTQEQLAQKTGCGL